MHAFLPRFSLTEKAIPFALLGITVLSFGLLIPWLGFYWDDWPVMYMTETQGATGFWDFYQYDRPFSAWTYIVFAPLLGTSPLVWQIFTLLLRWLTAACLWACLRIIWPEKPLQSFWVAALFAVCPIFTQQYVAVAYSQHWICYLLYFCSVYLMLKAQQARRTFYLLTILSAGLSLVQMLTMEYFLGLELLRPVILWLYFRERESSAPIRETLRRVAAAGWIYGALLIVYVIWRMFFLRLAEPDPNQPVFFGELLNSPIQALLGLLQKALQDFLYLVLAWFTAVKPSEFDLQRPFSLAILVIAVLGSILFGMILSRYRPSEEGTVNDRWYVQALVLGALGIVLGTLPVWLINRQVSVGPLGSRFGLAAMFGLSLLFVGFLEWLSPRRGAKFTVICLLIGVAIHTNLHIAKAYQQAWEKQRAFYWQLFWRAPYLPPGTAFISDGEIFSYVGLYSTSMGISLLYPPVDKPQEVPYWFFSYWERLYRFPEEIVSGITLEEGLRNHSFRGDSRNAILLDFAPEANRCLRLLSLREADDPDLSEAMRGLLSISNLGRIERAPRNDWQPPTSIFGPEPEPAWCYYYEKAELANQYEDWEGVIRLMDEAKSRGFAPIEMKEFMPLLEAYLQTGEVETARALSLQMARLSNNIDDRVCSAWQEALNRSPDPELESAFKEVRDKSGCFD